MTPEQQMADAVALVQHLDFKAASEESVAMFTDLMWAAIRRAGVALQWHQYQRERYAGGDPSKYDPQPPVTAGGLGAELRRVK